MKKIFLLLYLLVLIVSSKNFAFAEDSTVTFDVCFTPYQNCTEKLVQLINAAQKTIYVQAYTFTSRKIERALINAFARGIKVSMIFDHSQFLPDHYSSAPWFVKAGIPVWDDNQLNIAHNKVMIFDGKIVETGSFNYTSSAQKYNAENMLIIHNSQLAQLYFENWSNRLKVSKKVERF